MPAANSRSKTTSGKKPPANAVPALDFVSAPKTAAIILVYGPEDYLGSRVLAAVRSVAREQYPDLEVIDLNAAAYQPGELLLQTSPSLFGGVKLLQIADAASTSDAFLADALDYVANPAPDCSLVVRHSGGVRGKKLLDALAAAGYPRIECQPLKKDVEKAQFVAGEFSRAQRRIDRGAVGVLLASVGSDLSELAGACNQLIQDTEGTVSKEQVDKYYGDRVEATAFKVADSAVAGQAAVALSNLRYALATGIDPVPLVATLAMKVRQVAKVFDAQGSSASLAKRLAMAPWQIDAARRDASRFTEDGLARSLQALALADAQVKGASRDPVYAVERAVIVVAQAARGR